MATLEKVIGVTFDIIVADGTSTKKEVIPDNHPCSNMLLSDLLFGVPALTTANKKVTLELFTKRGNKIYGKSNLDASTTQSYHLPFTMRALMGATTLEISSDADVNGDKLFNIELYGIGYASFKYMNVLLSNEPSLLLILEQEGNG